MCQTPPRVVTHQIAVEKPSRTTSQRRSTIERTPRRPTSAHAMPTVAAASPALTIGCQVSACSGPTSATSGISRMAGNGANGT